MRRNTLGIIAHKFDFILILVGKYTILLAIVVGRGGARRRYAFDQEGVSMAMQKCTTPAVRGITLDKGFLSGKVIFRDLAPAVEVYRLANSNREEWKMKPTLLLCLLLLALAIPSRAEDNARWDIGLVSGVASSDLTLGKSVSSYCSPSYDGASMPERALLLITEIRECDKGYGATETLYGVVTRGKKYYARAAEVREVKEEEIAKLRDLSEEDRVKYEDAILKSSKLFWMEEVQKSFAFLEKTVKQGIAVLTASIYDISEYTEGTGFRITFYNPTKKTIKYVTVTYVGYNAVKDPVRDYRHPKAVLTLKGIGPIAPGESGGYNQDYAWMTDVVEDFKLTGITVQYMDGSKKTVKRPDNVSMSWTAYQTLKTYLAEESEAESAEEEKAQANGLAAPAAEVTK